MTWFEDLIGQVPPRFSHETVYLELLYTSVGGSMTNCCKLNLASGISRKDCCCDSGCEHEKDRDSFSSVHLGLSDLRELRGLVDIAIETLEKDKTGLK